MESKIPETNESRGNSFKSPNLIIHANGQEFNKNFIQQTSQIKTISYYDVFPNSEIDEIISIEFDEKGDKLYNVKLQGRSYKNKKKIKQDNFNQFVKGKEIFDYYSKISFRTHENPLFSTEEKVLSIITKNGRTSILVKWSFLPVKFSTWETNATQKCISIYQNPPQVRPPDFSRENEKAIEIANGQILNPAQIEVVKTIVSKFRETAKTGKQSFSLLGGIGSVLRKEVIVSIKHICSAFNCNLPFLFIVDEDLVSVVKNELEIFFGEVFLAVNYDVDEIEAIHEKCWFYPGTKVTFYRGFVVSFDALPKIIDILEQTTFLAVCADATSNKANSNTINNLLCDFVDRSGSKKPHREKEQHQIIHDYLNISSLNAYLVISLIQFFLHLPKGNYFVDGFCEPSRLCQEEFVACKLTPEQRSIYDSLITDQKLNQELVNALNLTIDHPDFGNPDFSPSQISQIGPDNIWMFLLRSGKLRIFHEFTKKAICEEKRTLIITANPILFDFIQRYFQIINCQFETYKNSIHYVSKKTQFILALVDQENQYEAIPWSLLLIDWIFCLTPYFDPILRNSCWKFVLTRDFVVRRCTIFRFFVEDTYEVYLAADSNSCNIGESPNLVYYMRSTYNFPIKLLSARSQSFPFLLHVNKHKVYRNGQKMILDVVKETEGPLNNDEDIDQNYIGEFAPCMLEKIGSMLIPTTSSSFEKKDNTNFEDKIQFHFRQYSEQSRKIISLLTFDSSYINQEWNSEIISTIFRIISSVCWGNWELMVSKMPINLSLGTMKNIAYLFLDCLLTFSNREYQIARTFCSKFVLSIDESSAKYILMLISNFLNSFMSNALNNINIRLERIEEMMILSMILSRCNINNIPSDIFIPVNFYEAAPCANWTEDDDRKLLFAVYSNGYNSFGPEFKKFSLGSLSCRFHALIEAYVPDIPVLSGIKPKIRQDPANSKKAFFYVMPKMPKSPPHNKPLTKSPPHEQLMPKPLQSPPIEMTKSPPHIPPKGSPEFPLQSPINESPEHPIQSPINETQDFHPPSPINEMQDFPPPSPINETQDFHPPSPINEMQDFHPPSPINETQDFSPRSPINETQDFPHSSPIHESAEYSPQSPIKESPKSLSQASASEKPQNVRVSHKSPRIPFLTESSKKAIFMQKKLLNKKNANIETIQKIQNPWSKSEQSHFIQLLIDFGPGLDINDFRSLIPLDDKTDEDILTLKSKLIDYEKEGNDDEYILSPPPQELLISSFSFFRRLDELDVNEFYCEDQSIIKAIKFWGIERASLSPILQDALKNDCIGISTMTTELEQIKKRKISQNKKGKCKFKIKLKYNKGGKARTPTPERIDNDLADIKSPHSEPNAKEIRMKKSISGGQDSNDKETTLSKGTPYDTLDGKIAVLPINVSHDISLISLGVINTNPAFSNIDFIYPVGYLATSIYYGMKVECSIENSNDEPFFIVAGKSNRKKERSSGKTPEEAWYNFFVNVMKTKPYSFDLWRVPGHELFGLCSPLTKRLIQALPNAPNCHFYKPLMFRTPASEFGFLTAPQLSQDKDSFEVAPNDEINSKIEEVPINESTNSPVKSPVEERIPMPKKNISSKRIYAPKKEIFKEDSFNWENMDDEDRNIFGRIHGDFYPSENEEEMSIFQKEFHDQINSDEIINVTMVKSMSKPANKSNESPEKPKKRTYVKKEKLKGPIYSFYNDNDESSGESSKDSDFDSFKSLPKKKPKTKSSIPKAAEKKGKVVVNPKIPENNFVNENAPIEDDDEELIPEIKRDLPKRGKKKEFNRQEPRSIPAVESDDDIDEYRPGKSSMQLRKPRKYISDDDDDDFSLHKQRNSSKKVKAKKRTAESHRKPKKPSSKAEPEIVHDDNQNNNADLDDYFPIGNINDDENLDTNANDTIDDFEADKLKSFGDEDDNFGTDTKSAVENYNANVVENPIENDEEKYNANAIENPIKNDKSSSENEVETQDFQQRASKNVSRKKAILTVNNLSRPDPSSSEDEEEDEEIKEDEYLPPITYDVLQSVPSPPPVKKRGRPRKADGSSRTKKFQLTNTDSSGDDENDDEFVPIKNKKPAYTNIPYQGRGRPRKYPLSSSSASASKPEKIRYDESDDGSNDDFYPGRKNASNISARGRSRKVPSQSESNDDDKECKAQLVMRPNFNPRRKKANDQMFGDWIHSGKDKKEPDSSKDEAEDEAESSPLTVESQTTFNNFRHKQNIIRKPGPGSRSFIRKPFYGLDEHEQKSDEGSTKSELHFDFSLIAERVNEASKSDIVFPSKGLFKYINPAAQVNSYIHELKKFADNILDNSFDVRKMLGFNTRSSTGTWKKTVEDSNGNEH